MPELLPYFLRKETAQFAMETTAKSIVDSMGAKLVRHSFHIVMLVPQMEYEQGQYPDCPIKPHKLAEYSHGKKESWVKHDFANIAQCKALQLWHKRSDGDGDTKAHLLFPGDTPFWGGVFREEIVVACSGVQPEYDRMISGMVADMSIAIARNYKMVWMRGNPDLDFIPG